MLIGLNSVLSELPTACSPSQGWIVLRYRSKVGVEPANDCGIHLLSELRIITVAAIGAFKRLVAHLSLDGRLLQEAGFRPSVPSVVRACRSSKLNP